MTNRALPLLAVSLLAACSFAPRKPFVPQAARQDAAAVYFYRPSEMTARLVKPTISAGDKALGKLANDSYAVAYLPPGEATLRSQWPGIPGSKRDDSVALSLEAGKSYFVRVRYQTRRAKQLTPGLKHIGGLSFEDRTGLETVDEAEAVKQMAGMAALEGFGAAAP
jgi:hypothetical protein